MYIGNIVPKTYSRPYPIIKFNGFKANHSTCGTTTAVDREEIAEDAKYPAPIVEKWTYRNYTNNIITLVDRSGIALEIHPQIRPRRRDLCIRRHIIIQEPRRKSLIKLLNSRLDFNSAELTILKEVIEQIQPHYYNECEFIIEYNITPEDLAEFKNSIYHYQTDKVFHVGDVMSAPKHPYASDNTDINAFRSEAERLTDTLQIKIEYISNTLASKPYWIKILGKVLPLIPHVAAPYSRLIVGKSKRTIINNPEYIRVYSTSFTITGDPFIDVQTLSIEEAKDRLHICDTQEQAMSLPTEEQLKEEKILALKEGIESMKLELHHQKELSAIEEEKRNRISIEQQSNIDRLKHVLELEKIAALGSKANLEKMLNDSAIELQKSRQKLQEAETQLKQAEILSKQYELDQRMRHEHIQREAELRHARELEIRKQAEYEAQIKQEKELERLKEESIRIKNKYEKKSIKRKDRSEIFKIIPTVLITMSAIFGFFIGRRKNG